MEATHRSEDERQQQALDWFTDQFEWYAWNAKKARRKFVFAQGTAIVLTAVTPVIVVIESLPVELRGLPAVVATIALAMSNLFLWRENWLRFTQTAGALERERLMFDTRTGAYASIQDANARFTHYVASASTIVSSEYTGWQEQLLRRAKEVEGRPTGPSGPPT